jgi:hypothetical protein
VGPQQLARVTDPKALDSADGQRAKLAIKVPPNWLEEGASLEVTTPKLLSCHRCDGGGCDSCERSGALSAPRKAELRRIKLAIPPRALNKGALQIRLVDPFDDSDIHQLFVQVRTAAEPSRGVKRIEEGALAETSELLNTQQLLLRVAIIIAVVVVLTLLLSR